MTWITGAVAFLASIGTAFTGYLVQTNFDSQWIARRGKGRDQLGRHRRLVQRAERRPGAAHPRGTAAARRSAPSSSGTSCWCAGGASCRRSTSSPTARTSAGAGHRAAPRPRRRPVERPDPPLRCPGAGPKRRYDIVKEFAVALAVVTVLTVALAACSARRTRRPSRCRSGPPRHRTTSSPRPPPSSTAPAAPRATAPPYVNIAGAGQQHRAAAPAEVGRGADPGRHRQRASCVDPLRTPATATPWLTRRARASGTRADTAQQHRSGPTAYTEALGKAPDNDPAKVAPPATSDPVPVMTAACWRRPGAARSTDRSRSAGSFFQTDYTRSVLFLADGTYLEDKAVAQHLGGDQSGMMNETGSYPGPGVALALHVLVPDQAVQQRGQLLGRERRRGHLGDHGDPQPRPGAAPLRPRRPVGAAVDPGPPPHLEEVVRRAPPDVAPEVRDGGRVPGRPGQARTTSYRADSGASTCAASPTTVVTSCEGASSRWATSCTCAGVTASSCSGCSRR